MRNPLWLVPVACIAIVVTFFIYGPVVYELTAPLVFGGLTGIAISRAIRDQRNTKRDRLFAKLPREVHILEENEETGIRTIAVTLISGELITTTVPLSYDPDQDGGAGLFRAILGDEAYEELEPHLRLHPDA